MSKEKLSQGEIRAKLRKSALRDERKELAKLANTPRGQLAKCRQSKNEIANLEARLNELYGQFVAGSDSAADKMISEGQTLVRWLAGSFAKKSPFRLPHLDDLISEGYQKLTEVVGSLAPTHEPMQNFCAYIKKAVRNVFARHLHDTETVVGESFDTRVAYLEPWTRENPPLFDGARVARNNAIYRDMQRGGNGSAEVSLFLNNLDLVERIADEQLAESSRKDRPTLLRLGLDALWSFIHGLGKPHDSARIRSARISTGTPAIPRAALREMCPAYNRSKNAYLSKIKPLPPADAAPSSHIARFNVAHANFGWQCRVAYESGRWRPADDSRTLVKRNVNHSIAWAIRTAMKKEGKSGTRIDDPSSNGSREDWFGQLDSPDSRYAIDFLDIKEAIEHSIETDDERRVVDMRVAGITLEEIAEQLGVSKSTVDRWLGQIKDRVRKQLQGIRDIQSFFLPRDARDAIDRCCNTKTERRVVTHRSQGASDAETAEKLGLSVVTIKSLRNNVERLFRDHCRAIDGLLDIQPDESRYAIRWPRAQDCPEARSNRADDRRLRVDQGQLANQAVGRSRMQRPAGQKRALIAR